MTYRIIFLPLVEKTENFAKVWQKIQDTPAFFAEKGSNIQCRKDGVCTEGTDGIPHKIAGQSTEFIFHSDSGITQKDIDTLPDDHSFGNAFTSGVSINGKMCSYVVMQKDKTINPNVVNALLLSSIKRADKIPDNEEI